MAFAYRELWNMDGGSLRLEVGSANDFAPFFGFVDNELFEFGKRRRHRLGAELGEFSSSWSRIGDAVIDRFAQRLDDRVHVPFGAPRPKSSRRR